MIPTEIKDKILHEAELSRVIGEFITLKPKGTKLLGECPQCKKKDGLSVSKAKQIAKCFSCGYTVKSPPQFIMDFKKVSFPAALKIVAGFYGIDVNEAPRPKGPQKKLDKPHIETFRDRMMKASGISEENQQAKVWRDENTEEMVSLFESGTKDQFGKLASGDDMIIWYYDLEGKQITYQKPKSTRQEPLFRVRWQNPDLHKDKSGRPMKYSSPYGSGSHLFIPEQLRQIYKERRPIKRLFIQEGEKKANKACIHGLPSVGVMGIQNIASQGQLPFDLQLIIQGCQVEEVIFVIDADWDHLSNDLRPGDKVDKRPYNFYYAVRNFRDYMKTFVNMGIYLDIYFAYVKPNEKNDKGIDDLLANTLAGNERELLEDINHTANEKSGSGKYIQLNKISAVADLKLMEFWHLQSAEDFANRYKDELIHLPEFMIGRHKWRFNEGGKIEPAQPLQEDEQYWDIIEHTDSRGQMRKEIRFRYHYAYTFLKRRGFGRLMMANRQYQLARIENKVVDIYEAYQVRDYMTEFTKEIVDKPNLVDVMDMLYRGGKMYFGPDSLGNIDFMHPKFETAGKNYQMLFFRNKYWKISADGIEEHGMDGLQYNVWRDKINDFDAKLLGNDFIKVTQIDANLISKLPADQQETLKPYIGQFDLSISPQAEQCHYLKFIYNTGEFFWREFIDPNGWRPLPKDNRSLAERMETNLHFISKMTAFGYLLHKFRDKSCEKAVVAMDGRLSEVGESNGRTGKSIAGFGIGKVVPQTYISGKNKSLTEDPFIWEEVSEKIDNIFIDDARANIDLEFFFPVITGRITINTKGTKKYTLTESETPKIYISTNHSINGEGSSFKDRQMLIAFSDYYNDRHKPVDDFGLNFFDEWDELQWNLFYNFNAYCLYLYFLTASNGWGQNGTGLIQCPTERLERRRLRQFLGETFLTWADAYFGSSDDIDSDNIENSNLNRKIGRAELFENFIEKNKNEFKFVNAHKFKKKVMAYCTLRKFKLNPHKEWANDHPGDDKSGGVEYFTIANVNYINI